MSIDLLGYNPNRVCLSFYKKEMKERILPVVGSFGLYHVSNLGEVFSNHRHGRGKRGKALKPIKLNSGYLTVTLCVPDEQGKKRKRTRYIHDLVMQAFIGPRPKGAVICHWDDDKENNTLGNLRYDVMANNMMDAKFNKSPSRVKCYSDMRVAITCAYTGVVLVYLGDLMEYHNLFPAFLDHSEELPAEPIKGPLTLGREVIPFNSSDAAMASVSHSALDAGTKAAS